MGNCAGKSKDLATEREAPLPAEEPTAPAAETVSVPQEQEGGETKKEEPSAVTSEAAPAKVDEPTAEVKPVEEAKPSVPAAVEIDVVAEVQAVEEKPKEEAKTEALVATA